MATRSTTQAGPTVPFLDLAPMHRPLEPALLDDIARALSERGVHERSGRCRVRAGVCRLLRRRATASASRSGLDALRLGLARGRASSPATRSIVPAATFVATLEAVTQAGGVPVVVDVSEDDYCLDPEAAAAAVGPRTHALMPVHLYGQLADMRALRARRRRRRHRDRRGRLPGARRRRATAMRAGASGVAAAFSFYPGKNLGAAGDAGALVTRTTPSSPPACARCASTARRRSTSTRCEGWTSRLDTIQALVLLHKLPQLETLERPAPRSGRVLHGRALGRRRPAAAAGRCRAALPCGISTSCARATPTASEHGCATAGSAPAATTRTRCI